MRYITQILEKLKNQKIWVESKIKNLQDDNNTFNNFNSVIKPNLNETELRIINKEFKDSSINNQSTNRKANVSKIVPKKLLSIQEIF